MNPPEKTSAREEALGSPSSAQTLLDRHYLEMRSALLETAAALDRIERAPGSAEAFEDPRLQNLIQSLRILEESGADRAERFQQQFSCDDGQGPA